MTAVLKTATLPRQREMARSSSEVDVEQDYWLKWREVLIPLVVGTDVTIGREPQSDIVLPEEDLFLGREAGTVRVLEDHLEVVYQSGTLPLLLRPSIGEDVVVRKGSSATTRDMPYFSIVLVGKYGVEYEIGGHGPATLPRRDGRKKLLGAATAGRPFELTDAESAFIVELCRPMVLTQGPSAAPATYAAIANKLGRSQGTIKNLSLQIRRKLTESGVPGLDGNEQEGDRDFRKPLADFAVNVDWAFEERKRC